MFDNLRPLFGRVSGTLDVTDHGFAPGSTIEMK
jgi:hypothetical protein